MEFDDSTAVPIRENDVLTTLQKQFDALPTRFQHNMYTCKSPWPTTTSIWCYHCCHPFSTMPVPLVSRYDHDRRLPVGFGNFCSPNCARAYAIEHRPLSWSQAMCFYSVILRDSFGISPEDSTRPAYPKERLSVFGGDLSIEEFRAGFSTPTVLRVESVTFCMQNLSLVEVSPDQGRGVSVGMAENGDEEAEDGKEHGRLQALAACVISKARKKQQDKQDKDEKDQVLGALEDSDEDGEVSASHGSSRHENGASILAAFVQNLRAFKGDEKATRAAMMNS